MNNIADIRKDYKLQVLEESSVHEDAIKQFGSWWDDALESGIDEVNAFTLATADANGKPSARILLLKGFDENGFIFFTNYESHKGRELAINPSACMVFFWKELERQVRIEGRTEKISAEASDEYFNSRPEGSRIGAWASPQSSTITTREVIEENAKRYERKFSGGNIARPPHWGGYCLRPHLIEFWQGRPSRLHDRIQYTGTNSGWTIERLAP
jgi:pyridoxamine 5'-phosphate oxidase